MRVQRVYTTTGYGITYLFHDPYAKAYMGDKLFQLGHASVGYVLVIFLSLNIPADNAQ